MFGKRIKLFTLLGFEVRIDLSWIIIALLITWSLSKGLFPAYYKNLSTQTYWWMGIISALGLFLSIIAHEFSHSLVARKYGIPMKGITLFIFGGVAEMDEEPPSPKVEFMMAIAGPLSSFIIALIFYGIHAVGKQGGLAEPINGVVGYLGWINAILAAFNLLPPLEASGTSGMKAALNGVPNLSIMDGWWVEGFNGKNGWAFAEGAADSDRDKQDAEAINQILEKEIIPLYFKVSDDGIPHEWVKAMKESVKSNAPKFSARRMVKEYVERYYAPALQKA